MLLRRRPRAHLLDGQRCLPVPLQSRRPHGAVTALHRLTSFKPSREPAVAHVPMPDTDLQGLG